jgi:UDP-N-acetylmuramate--alanine ligase
MSKYYFCAIAGSGMSALAQMAAMEGNSVSGSDRSFDQGKNIDIKTKFENIGIKIFPQDSTGITSDIDFFVVSTAVEDNNPDIIRARELGLNIIHRSELLSRYVNTHRTIAVAGTSGKSTTTAMIWHILNQNGFEPSVINGAYINSLMSEKLIGNAYMGSGDILVIEADESDATIKKYRPEIALILNISRDHKSIDELKDIFLFFSKQSKNVFLNEDDFNLMDISKQIPNSVFFGHKSSGVEIKKLELSRSEFEAFGENFSLPMGGIHNIENAIAATAVAKYIGVDIKDISKALSSFKGTFRRFNIIGEKNGITVIDDYAHNPQKIAAILKAFNSDPSKRIIAIYQPHGFGPTRMLKDELVEVFCKNLKSSDILIMPEIFYSGGTVSRDISSQDIVTEVSKKGIESYYFNDRNLIPPFLINKIRSGDIIGVIGARDNSLHNFAVDLFNII